MLATRKDPKETGAAYKPRGSATRIRAWYKRQPQGCEYALLIETLDGEREVCRWQADDAGRDDWGSEVMQAANDYAQEIDESINGRLVAYHDGVEVGQYEIRVRMPSRPTEGASPRGLLEMQMRHNEAIMRMMMQQTTATISALTRINDLAFARIHRLEAERSEALSLHTEAMRALAAAEALEEQATADETTILDTLDEKLEKWLPALSAASAASSMTEIQKLEKMREVAIALASAETKKGAPKGAQVKKKASSSQKVDES
jgi:hypothetical protein